MDSSWNPQLQLHVIVLPQHVTKEEDIYNQPRNFAEKSKETEPPQIKEEQEEQELPQIKLKTEKLYIRQDKEQLDLKEETETLMEIPTYEENDHSEVDLNNQQSFNVTDSEDEEGYQHEESSLTTDEETDPHNRDQKKKKRDTSHVQNVDTSHVSESWCDSDKKNSNYATLVKKLKQSPTNMRLIFLESGEISRNVSNLFLSSKTECDDRLYFCPECGQSFGHWSEFRIHKITHTGEKPFSCNECDKRFTASSDLKVHMRTHTGEKPFTCTERGASFSRVSSLKTHMKTHKEEPFSSAECGKSFSCVSKHK